MSRRAIFNGISPIGKGRNLLYCWPSDLIRKTPIVAIHGMWATNLRWRNYGKFFSDRGFRFFAPTLRHHFLGNQKVEALGKTGVEDYFADTARFICYLTENGFLGGEPLPRPIVFGHSMGGLIAQKVAEAGLASMLVLLNSAPPAGVKLGADWRYTLTMLRYLPKMLGGKPFKPSFRAAARYIFNGLPPEEQRFCHRNMVYESGRAAWDIRGGRVKVDFSKIRCPVLVIGAEKDRIVPSRVAEQIAKKIVHQEFDCYIYPQFAHGLPIEPGWEEPALHIFEWLQRYIEK